MIPPSITCENSACRRNLSTEEHHRRFPEPHTPPDLIHDNYDPSIGAYFSIYCPTCGHFMRWYPTAHPDTR